MFVRQLSTYVGHVMENGNKNGMITTTVCIISNSGRANLAPTKIPHDVHDANSMPVLH
jgi:hypothetical protein